MAALPRLLVAAGVLLALAAPAHAKDRDTVKITAVRVGLPLAADPAQSVTKFGTWAPVYVDLEVVGAVGGPAELVIESPDPDETNTSLVIPIPLEGIPPGTAVSAKDRGVVGYVRPGGGSGEVTVTVRAAGGGALSEPFRARVRPRDPLTYLVLGLGGKPAGFELPRPASAPPEAGNLRGGRVELAHIGEFSQLPDHWFGYDAADLIVLCTGTASDDFLTRLLSSATDIDKRKREALIEWVRRGGRIVISVATKADAVAKAQFFAPLLPVGVQPAPADWGRATGPVPITWTASGAGQGNTVSAAFGPKGQPVTLANLTPQRGRLVVTTPGATPEAKHPVAVQAAFGVGRVTVIGFDLDKSPFAEFPERADFWDWVLRDCGANRASAGDGKVRPPANTVSEDEDEAAIAVRVHSDTFESVPVVSFGWVALLIVVYILLIGPVEYYFLKRVLGRLELTWVTFPIIVATVSILAYVSAYSLKGRELKVNKLDVVDVDVASNRVYGTAWFTVFSPKIDTYSVGVTPGEGWVNDATPDGTAVWAVGAPRGTRASVVRRKYAVRPDADGLEAVPIQVWSTKTFASSWSARLNPESGPRRVESNLIHPRGDQKRVIGTFTHHLPVPELTDCVVFYAGQAYPLPRDTIVRGARVRLVLDQGIPATQWLQTKGNLEPLLLRVQAYAERPGQKAAQRQQAQAFVPGPLPMWGILFHEASLRRDEGVIARNASLRRLDLSWRLTADTREELLNRDEVIIVGRASPPVDTSESVLSGPYSPSQLRLKGGPGDRQPIPGTARQETWVRFILPIQASGGR